jgi:hypothetical protein
MSGIAVAITAGHQRAADRIDTSSLEEVIFEVTSTALQRAGLTAAGVDAVVISGYDQTDGRIISCMVTVGAAAGVGKNVTTLASAPEHGFAYAVLRLLSGQARNVLVVGWSKPSESVYPEHGELVGADPFLVRPIGMNRTIAAALQASVHAPPASPGTTYTAWPLTQADCQPHADGVCAMVLEAVPAGVSPDRAVAWVRGVGWAMDRYSMGDRDDLEAGGLDAAVRQALTQAGADFGPVDSVDAFTVGAPNERRVAERVVTALGDAQTTVYASSDVLNPDFAAGLFAVWRAAERVMTPGTSHRAAAVSTLGFAAQGSTVVLLSDTVGA